jgi:prepilin-type N-terminal cleavage/methylation domain-containing protein
MTSHRRSHRGFSLLELSLSILVIVIVGAIAIPNLLALGRETNELSAIKSLKATALTRVTGNSSAARARYMLGH